LDDSVKLGLLLLKLGHELLVESGVTHNPLPQLLKIRVGCKSSKWVGSCIRCFITIIVRHVLQSGSWSWLVLVVLMRRRLWNSGHKIFKRPVRISECSPKSSYAIIVVFSRNTHKLSHLPFVNAY
jgi:hypothetical protein